MSCGTQFAETCSDCPLDGCSSDVCSLDNGQCTKSELNIDRLYFNHLAILISLTNRVWRYMEWCKVPAEEKMVSKRQESEKELQENLWIVWLNNWPWLLTYISLLRNKRFLLKFSPISKMLQILPFFWSQTPFHFIFYSMLSTLFFP